MPKYRKKPVTVEAHKFTGSTTSKHAIEWWMLTGVMESSEIHTRDLTTLEIVTLEGIMTASPGDYIIKGVNGEFYPCKPDIFRETYEYIEE